MLSPAIKITPPEWMRDPDLVKVLDVLNDDDINARMVGGCIRNLLVNKSVHDIDIATKLTPESVVIKMDVAGIRTLPIGIAHGTVVAHINGKNFEITTLRRDEKTDGRHAEVVFTDDWVQDARRRDFTINALYADRDGSIYDPLGQGLADIENRIVRFIGDAEERIKEDYLRILRFFRFYACYHNGKPDGEAMAACIAMKGGLSQLSDERIAEEMAKILIDPSAPRAIHAMQKCGLFNLTEKNIEGFDQFVADRYQLNQVDVMGAWLYIGVDIKYIKNNRLIKLFNLISEFIKSWDGNIKRALYHFDRDSVVQGLLILKARGKGATDDHIAAAMTQKIPQFPIVADDIMQRFHIPQGPEVGRKLKAAETFWIDQNFLPNREEILAHLTVE